MILSTNFSLFPSGEFFTFSKNVIMLADEKKSAIPVIAPFLGNATTRLADFKSALEREERNPLVKIRTQMGDYRFDAFMALRKQAESAASRRKAGVPEAAHVIIEAIRKYGWTIQQTGQKARTALLDGLITELKIKYPAEVEIIGASELLDELEQAQADYQTADADVSRSVVEMTEPTVSETRPPLTEAIRQLFQIISLQQTAAPSDEVTALIASLNNLITASLATVKATDTRAENAKTKVTEPQTV